LNQSLEDESLGIDNIQFDTYTSAKPVFESESSVKTFEKSDLNDIIYSAAAADVSKVKYSLQNADPDLFSIDEVTGQVRLLKRAKFDDINAANNSVGFTVRATDPFGNFADKSVNLAIEDSSLAFWKNGVYRVDSVDRSGSLPSANAVSLKDQRNRPLSDSLSRNWNGLGVIKSNDGYRMLQIGERGRNHGRYRIAELDNDGVLQKAGRWLSQSDAVAHGYQELFELDLNADGYKGIPVATDTDSNGFADGLGHYRLMGASKNVDFKGRRGALLSARSSTRWDALMAKETASGFDVLIQGRRGRTADKYQVWKTDQNGTVTSNGTWMDRSTLVNEGYESVFNKDLDGDGVVMQLPTQAMGNKSMYLSPHVDYMKADGIQIKANPSLDLSGELTIAFWLNRDASQTPQFLQGIFQSYMLTIQSDGTLEWSRSNSGSTDQFSVQGSTGIPVNQWTHISAVMREMGDGTYNAELWVNGQLYASSSSTEGIQNTQNDLSIMSAGKFDNIQIWNKALAQSELPLVANNQGFDISRDSLIAEYTFENDTGGTNTNAFDSSGNGNHGVLVGENGGTIVQEVSDQGPGSPDQKVVGATSASFIDTNGDGFVDGMGHYMLKGLSTTHAVDFKGRRGTILSAGSSRSWDALMAQAKGDGTGFDVLIQGTRGRNKGQYQVWQTDANGTVTSNGRWINLDTLVNEGYETTFTKDFNGDGDTGSPQQIGALDTNGDGFVDGITNYTLFKSAVSPSSAQAIDLLDRRCRNLSDRSSRQWNAIKAVETLDGDFKVLVQGERGRRRTQYQVWTADETGLITDQSRWQSGNQLSLAGFESVFDIDINGNGFLGV